MVYQIHNDRLCLSVDPFGAQMMSLQTSDGREYLWQGDSTYWADRAPVLFPVVGRLMEQAYSYGGKRYSMDLHGFAMRQEFALADCAEDYLVLELRDDAHIRTGYPFSFLFQIEYRLENNRVCICYRVKNEGETTMPFAVGGHPGFRIPLMEGEKFEDHYLEFSQPCQPLRTGFSERFLITGEDTPFPLVADRRLPLKHSLFEGGAILLQNVSREVRLCSAKSGNLICVEFPQMPYLGIWHLPKSDAPYVCLEPWSALPGREGVMEDFTRKQDLVQLAPHDTYENRWSLTIEKNA